MTDQLCGALLDWKVTRMSMQELLELASVVTDGRFQFGLDGHQDA